MKYTKLIGGVIVASALTVAAVMAYDSGAKNSLLRARDQVADQRFQLQKSYNEVDRRIEELQRQKHTIMHYLHDCDRTMRDLDRALNAQDAAHRGH